MIKDDYQPKTNTIDNIMHFRRPHNPHFQHLSVIYVESKSDGNFHRVQTSKMTKMGIPSEVGDHDRKREGAMKRREWHS